MTKITARDLSPEAFEAWREVPWFQTFLQNEIDIAEGALVALGQRASFGPRENVDLVRDEAAAMAGRKSALETFQELEYIDVVEEEDEEA